MTPKELSIKTKKQVENTKTQSNVSKVPKMENSRLASYFWQQNRLSIVDLAQFGVLDQIIGTVSAF